MQTEEAIKLNGQSELLSDAQNLYPVDAETFTAQTLEERAGRKIIVSHTFSRPELKHIIEREKAVVRETEQIGKGRDRVKFNADAANSEFYNQLCIGVSARVHGSDKPAREWPKEEVARLAIEKKSDAVNKLLECRAKVRDEGDDDFSFLFDEGEGEIIVDLSIGEEDNPSYTLAVHMSSPPPERRTQFRASFSQLQNLRGGDKPRSQIVTDLHAGVKFFDSFFSTVEGVMIDGQPYTDEKKKEFLRLFNPLYKCEIATALCAYYQSSSGN